MKDRLRESLKRMIDAGEFERIAQHIDEYNEAEYITFLYDELCSADLDKMPIIELIHMIDSAYIWRALMVEMIAEETI